MSQHDTCDGDAEYARVGEVGQAKTTGLVLLTEDHILLGPDQRSPRAHAPLQRATNAGADLRMAPSDARRFLLRGQSRIVLDAVAGGPAEAGLGGSSGSSFAMSVNHVQPHLVVSDVKAGQWADPSNSRRIRHLTRSLTTARPHWTPWGKVRRRGWTNFARATPSLRPSSPGPFSS